MTDMHLAETIINRERVRALQRVAALRRAFTSRLLHGEMLEVPAHRNEITARMTYQDVNTVIVPSPLALLGYFRAACRWQLSG